MRPRSLWLRWHDVRLIELSNFVIEYLCKNKKVRETVLASSSGVQVESFEHKNRGRKSRDTVPLTNFLQPDCISLLKQYTVLYR